MKWLHDLVGLLFLTLILFFISFSSEKEYVYIPLMVEKEVESFTNIFPEVIVLPEEIPLGVPIKQELLKYPIERASGFGMRINPFTKKMHFHMGMDLTCEKGTKITNTALGIVVRVQRSNSGYGNNVIIEHTNNSYRTLYAHMDKIYVEPGDTLFRGYIIGTVGSTGLSTCPHLHYEIFEDGKRVNPLPFMKEVP